MVYPSGAAWATASSASLAPAPGRFSTMTCWRQISDSRLATMRDAKSVPPPGGKPTTSFTTRDGNVSARATWAKGASAAAPVSCRKRRRGKSIVFVPRLSRKARGSFRFQIGKLDHLAPFGGLTGAEPAKVRRRARQAVAAEIGKARLELG